MGIYIGDQPLTRRFVGDREVQRVYQGDQLVWQQGPSYPVSGSWAGGAVPFSGNPVTTPLLVDTHTIGADGNYTITWSVDFTTANLSQSRIHRDGAKLEDSGAYTFPATATATWTGTCTARQVIQFYAASAGTAGSVASGGTWNITKN